ncbi:hypothetical protein [Luteimonas kalidii]|uniref:DUF3298 domain-containing protein n=1 Tax=Luteimonas kalidii TaxID=3042025 RepID=A0ABT6JX49_9GAMM|nr:hypothetical protein [Luteimonas kalidii]MDH5835047.1 hypothetical protein [Luteimonas kalidii]
MPPPRPVIAADARADAGGWWDRNRFWLLGALVLGVLAFWLPYRDAVHEFQDRREPRHARDVAAGQWGEYEGSRWRLAGVRRVDGLPAAFAGYPHGPSSLLIVSYDVIPGREATPDLLDRCKGRLSDAQGRTWDADAIPHASLDRAQQRLGTRCGSRTNADFEREAARAGEPFRFHHLYQVPRDVPTAALRGEIAFPPFTTTPPGTYVRFELGSAAARD